MPINVNVQTEEIEVSTSGQTVSATVGGGQGPQGQTGPAGPPGTTDYAELENVPSEFPPEAHAASHAAAGSDPVTVAVSQVDGLGDELAGKLPLAGGAMDSTAVVTFSDGTNDSEVGGWGFGVELTADTSQYATVEPTAVTVQGTAGGTTITPAGITLANSTQVIVGSFDNATGGYNGLGLICAVGYELNWQGGRLRSVAVGGDATPMPIFFDSQIVLPASGIEFSGDSTVQTTAWTGAFSYNDLDDVPPEFPPEAHSHAIADVTGLQTALDGLQPAGDYATLVGGLVPAAQLPSYVDDVLEYANAAAFPATGETGKIYVALDTNKVHRWSGSAYIEISPSPGSTDSVTEGATNLYFTNARASAAAPVQSVAGRTGAVTLAVADVSGAVSSSDSRLSDTRTPTDGSVTAAKIAAGQTFTLTTLLATDISIQTGYISSVVGGGGGISTLGALQVKVGSSNVFEVNTSGVVTTGTWQGSAVGVAYGGTGATTAGGALTNLGAAAATHTHAASDITSGTIATARLGSGTANSTTFLRGDQTWGTPSSSVTYATAAQAQAGLSSTTAISPQRWRDAFLSWRQVTLQGGVTANGGTFNLWNNWQAFGLITTTTTSGTAVARANTPADLYMLLTLDSTQATSAKNWANTQGFQIRVWRQTGATNSVVRVQLGEKSTNTAFAQMTGRGIGFELRDRRVWLLAHDGTTLTQTDTGIDAGANASSPSEFIVWTDGSGTVSLSHETNGTVSTATTTGGPTSQGSAGTLIAAEATNGASATAITYYLTQPILMTR